MQHIIVKMMNCNENAVLFSPEIEIAATSTSSEQTTDLRLLSRDGLLCAALVMVCLVAAWPFAEIGINDDWSYLLSTQAFAHTHHFIYNGWAAPMLGWQALWGAVFAWLVRPDFIGIRLSMIPVAMATAVLFRAILRNFGLNRAHALFGTLTLTLGPVFLSLSATFMSDIPGLLVIFACIFLCQRALAAQDDKHAALWLVAAALTNIVGGTARQVAWLGLLVMVPCCGWLLRRGRYIVPLTVALWVGGGIAIKLLLIWFFRHPHTVPLSLLPGPVNAAAIAQLLKCAGQLVPTCLLLLFPVLVAGVAARWPPNRSQVLGAAAILGILCVVYVVSKRMGHPYMPDSLWTGNILTPFGIMQGPELFVSAHRIAPRWLMALFGILVLCAISFFTAIFRPHTPPSFTTEACGSSWHEINVLLLPFSVFYFLLLCPLALIGAFFDRYLLEIAAVLLVYMLRWHQERVSRNIPAIATATLAAIAFLGVASTHDLFSLARAEVRLTNALQEAGVPRTQIRAGFAFDSVTEVYATGYVSDPHLTKPSGSYHPPLQNQSGPCQDPFLIYVPALDVKYVVTSGPRPCTALTSFPPQSYRTWLPPATRGLFVAKPRTTP